MGAYRDDDMVITVNKDDLLKKLMANREAHDLEHRKALKGRRKKLFEAK